MQQTLPLRSLLVAACLALLLVTGCSERTVTVDGKVVLPPAIKLAKDDAVSITFLPEAPGKKAVTANFSTTDSTFVANGLTTGKHKITAKFDPYPGLPDSAKRLAAFEGINKKFDQTNSPLNYEVSNEAKQSITIEFDKGTVTKR
jgi:hypothetical protein